MKKNLLYTIVGFALYCSQLKAENFIDNPSFDLGKKGWLTWGCLYEGEYQEKTRNFIIFEKCFAYPFWQLSHPFVYAKSDVSSSSPLYFSVEVGMEDSNDLDVTVSLYEAEKYHIHKDDGNLLTQKKVKISDSTRWFRIASDYPVYKSSDDTDLYISISAKSDKEFGAFQLNYAQIGTDAPSLGGRGERDKPKSKFEEYFFKNGFTKNKICPEINEKPKRREL